MAIMIVLSDGTTYDLAENCFVVNVPADVKEENIEEWLGTEEAANARVCIEVKDVPRMECEPCLGDLYYDNKG